MAVCLERQWPVELAMVLGLVAGILAGLLNGAIIVGFGLPSLVVTIGTLALYRRIAQIILKERGVNSFPDWYQQIGCGTVGDTPIPWGVPIFLVLLVAFGFFLHFTRGGRSICAIGNNKEASRYSGIFVEREMVGVFVASGTVSSIAAIVLTAYLASAPRLVGDYKVEIEAQAIVD